LDVFSPNFNKPTDRPVQIICVGSFEEFKGHKYLVQACNILRDQAINFHCHFVGDGPVLEQIEKLIADLKLNERITIHGPLQRQGVAKILQESDIKAAPSAPTANGKREGMPNVLIEAMAAGLPIVSTQFTGIPELVEDKQTGFLVEPHNVEELAKALLKLCESSDIRIRMGKAGRKKVLEGFDRKKNARALLKLIVDNQSSEV
jgi:colanic acid/amylovoran biosynthesis glycosyltransferase